MARYWLSPDAAEDWREVTVEEFAKAERQAGFRNKAGGPTATGGFTGGGIRGMIVYDDSDPRGSIFDVAYIQVKAAMQCLEDAETGWEPLDELTSEAFNALDDAQAMLKPMIEKDETDE